MVNLEIINEMLTAIQHLKLNIKALEYLMQKNQSYNNSFTKKYIKAHEIEVCEINQLIDAELDGVEITETLKNIGITTIEKP